MELRTPHPPLRSLRQWQPHREHRQGARAAGRGATAAQTRASQAYRRRAACAADTLSMLRRTHARHRDVRAGQDTQAPAVADTGRDEDRHVMRQSHRLAHSSYDRTCWFSTGSEPAWPIDLYRLENGPGRHSRAALLRLRPPCSPMRRACSESPCRWRLTITATSAAAQSP